MHPSIARLRLQAEVDAARGRLAQPIDALDAIAGDGNGNVAIPNSHDIVCRDAATGRVLFAQNPDLHEILEGEALTLVPMNDRAPMLWRVPPERLAEVYWVAGADVGQTPGLFTPAHQFQFSPGGLTLGDVDVAPAPATPYQFYVTLGEAAYRIDPLGNIDRPFGGGASSALGGLVIPGSTWGGDLTIASITATPGGNLAMVEINPDQVHVQYDQDTIPDPFAPPNEILRFWNRYEYDEINLFSLEFTVPPQVRNIRIRFVYGYEYFTYFPYAPDGGPGGEPDPPFPADPPTLTGAEHFTCIRYNRANGHLFLCHDESDVPFIVSVPWDGATIPPATDPVVTAVKRPWPAGKIAHTIAFNAAGQAFVAGRDAITGGWFIWRWDYLLGTVAVVAGDGSAFPGGTFPADGSVATSGDIGSVGGMDFDATGKLLVACHSMHRIAELDVTAGTIRTLTGFGRAADSTEELVQPLATAVFTDISSLQTDAQGRPYIGGQQVKRIGA